MAHLDKNHPAKTHETSDSTDHKTPAQERASKLGQDANSPGKAASEHAKDAHHKDLDKGSVNTKLYDSKHVKPEEQFTRSKDFKLNTDDFFKFAPAGDNWPGHWQVHKDPTDSMHMNARKIEYKDEHNKTTGWKIFGLDDKNQPNLVINSDGSVWKRNDKHPEVWTIDLPAKKDANGNETKPEQHYSKEMTVTLNDKKELQWKLFDTNIGKEITRHVNTDGKYIPDPIEKEAKRKSASTTHSDSKGDHHSDAKEAEKPKSSPAKHSDTNRKLFQDPPKPDTSLGSYDASSQRVAHVSSTPPEALDPSVTNSPAATTERTSNAADIHLTAMKGVRDTSEDIKPAAAAPTDSTTTKTDATAAASKELPPGTAELRPAITMPTETQATQEVQPATQLALSSEKLAELDKDLAPQPIQLHADATVAASTAATSESGSLQAVPQARPFGKSSFQFPYEGSPSTQTGSDHSQFKLRRETPSRSADVQPENQRRLDNPPNNYSAEVSHNTDVTQQHHHKAHPFLKLLGAAAEVALSQGYRVPYLNTGMMSPLLRIPTTVLANPETRIMNNLNRPGSQNLNVQINTQEIQK